MSEIVCKVKSACPCQQGFGIRPLCGSCDGGFIYRDIDLATALKAVLKGHPSLLREVRRAAVKPSEIL